MALLSIVLKTRKTQPFGIFYHAGSIKSLKCQSVECCKSSMFISATEKEALNKHDVRRRLRNLHLTLLLFYSCQYSPVLRSLFSRAYCLTLSPLVFLDRKEKVELTNLLNTVTQTFH